MNVISYINGDTEITDFPACSAPELVVLVQAVNDGPAGTDGMLSPDSSVIALDLGWATVGTAGASDTVRCAWLAELLDSDWGVARFADARGRVAIERVADLCREAAAGRMPAKNVRESAKNDAYSVAISSRVESEVHAQAVHVAALAGRRLLGYPTDRNADYTAIRTILDVPESVTFVRSAIAAWRRLAGLDQVIVDHQAVDQALAEMAVTR